MKPKEKAKELVCKYNFEHLGDRYILHQTVEESKRCALIAVDELIVECWNIREIDLEKSCDYWKQVKQEIQNL